MCGTPLRVLHVHFFEFGNRVEPEYEKTLVRKTGIKLEKYLFFSYIWKKKKNKLVQ